VNSISLKERNLTNSSRTPQDFSKPAPRSCFQWRQDLTRPGVETMGLTLFFALCILGVDFMIYALFQWTWGDKRRAIARQVAAHRKAFDKQPRRPFVVPSQETLPGQPRSSSTKSADLFPRTSPKTRIA
jgi:hypothetical protein